MGNLLPRLTGTNTETTKDVTSIEKDVEVLAVHMPNKPIQLQPLDRSLDLAKRELAKAEAQSDCLVVPTEESTIMSETQIEKGKGSANKKKWRINKCLQRISTDQNIMTRNSATLNDLNVNADSVSDVSGRYSSRSSNRLGRQYSHPWNRNHQTFGRNPVRRNINSRNNNQNFNQHRTRRPENSRRLRGATGTKISINQYYYFGSTPRNNVYESNVIRSSTFNYFHTSYHYA